MNIIRLTSLDQPGLEPYKTLRQPLEHKEQGIFVAEGTKVVQRFLESNLELLSILLTPEWFQTLESVLSTRAGESTVYIAPKGLLETIVGFNLHQGIMAVGKIPTVLTLREVLAEARPPYLLAAVDGLTNAENLGVLVRNCGAFGVQAIIAGETSSSPYLRRAVRNSMGTVFSLPVAHVENLATSIRFLRERGIRTIAAHPHAEGELSDEDLRGSCCFVFGNEGEGVSDAILQACDTAVAIRMQNGVDSLNVASASAVFFFEAARQRKTG